MQNDQPTKRPVGRPRLSTAHLYPPTNTRTPRQSANIVSSNETTNLFLGPVTTQRPWMRPNANSSVNSLSTPSQIQQPTASHTGPTTRTPLTANPHTSSPLQNVNHVQPLTTTESPAPPQPITSASSPRPTSVVQNEDFTEQRSSVDLHNTHRHEQVATRVGIHTSSFDHVMDLTVPEANPPLDNSVQSHLASTPSTDHAETDQPAKFPELPVLEDNSEFDQVTDSEVKDVDRDNLAGLLPSSTLHSFQSTSLTSAPQTVSYSPQPTTTSIRVNTMGRAYPGAGVQLQRPSNIDTGQHIRMPSNTSRTSAQLLTPDASPLVQHSQQLPQHALPSKPVNMIQTPPTSQSQPQQIYRPSTGTAQQTNSIQSPGSPAPLDYQSRFAVLMHTIDDISARQTFDRVKLDHRTIWLREACAHHDLIFLLLHQLVCILSTQPAVAQYMCLHQDYNLGISVVESWLGRIKDLPGELFAFFAKWPYDPISLHNDPNLIQIVSRIGQTLQTLGSRWPTFQQNCLSRRAPPMISEIIPYLVPFKSPTLSSVIYCSIQRTLSPQAPQQLQEQVLHLFRHDMENTFNGRPGIRDFNVFHVYYRDIYARFLNTPGLNEAQVRAVRAILSSAPSPFQVQTALPRMHQNGRAVQVPPNLFNSNQAPRIPVQNNNPANLRRPSHLLRSNPHPVPMATPNQQMHLSYNNSSNAYIQPMYTSVQQTVQNPTFANVNHTAISPTAGQTLGSTLLLKAGHAPHEKARLLPLDPYHLPDLISNPDPSQEALHQVHLRPPGTEILGVRPDIPQRLFQFIEGFLLQPHSWLPSSKFLIVPFDVPLETLQRRSEVIIENAGPFERAKRVITPQSLLFHLRCVQLSNDQTSSDPVSSWAALSTHWPQHIFVSINGEHLEIRRKRQHVRDMPIDVTPFVHAGNNEITISIHPAQKESHIKHGIAVEVIGFHDLTHTVTLPRKSDPETSLNAITSTMTIQQDSNDDNDIVLVDDSMTISVTDPFSSRIYATPVRGQSCKHRECFDLETFLESRQSENKDGLTSVYGWQCPICRQDARPPNLVIDGFFQQVRDQLVAAGEEDTRAIIVKSDGSWHAKKEIIENPSADKRRSHSRDAAPSEAGDSKIDGISAQAGHNEPPSKAQTADMGGVRPTRFTQEPEVIVLD